MHDLCVSLIKFLNSYVLVDCKFTYSPLSPLSPPSYTNHARSQHTDEGQKVVAIGILFSISRCNFLASVTDLPNVLMSFFVLLEYPFQNNPAASLNIHSHI